MRSAITPGRVVIGVLVAVAASVAGLFIGHRPQVASAAVRPTAVPSELRSAFSIFRRDAMPANEVPERVRAFANYGPIRDKYAPNADLTRTATSGDGKRWYILPGDNGLCFYIADLGLGSCATTAEAEAGRLMIWEKPVPSLPNDQPVHVFGMVADDDRAVHITSGEGSSMPTIQDGIYITEVTRLASVSIVKSDSTEMTVVP